MSAGRTVQSIVDAGKDALQSQIADTRQLIYSSPATLAYNSPGAEGYGVKRAGLAIPDSIMLIVSPGCCGRNTSALSERPAYHNRFFYLTMDETDLITGRHLTKIPEAVQEVVDFLPTQPSVVMICITCVDALLGTDMERVCRKAEEAVGIPVRPCYMYALTREGRRPPMVHVRQSLYSLLEKRQRQVDCVNLLGYFGGVDRSSEIFDLLKAVGVHQIRQIAECQNMADFQEMSAANFNLVLNPEALPAAEDLHKRLGIPLIQMQRLYQIDKIAAQYRAFGQVLGVTFETDALRQNAEAAVDRLVQRTAGWSFAVGEVADANPFELALALLSAGCEVQAVYGTTAAEYWPWLEKLAALKPELEIYDNADPQMVHYHPDESGPVIAIGEDAAYYYSGTQKAAVVPWRGKTQPFGFDGVVKLSQAVCGAVDRAEQKGSTR